MSDRETRFAREVDDAFKARAHLYRLLLDVIGEKHGPDEAEAILTEVVHRRGVEVAAPLFAGCAVTPEAIGRRFLSVSPVEGTLYPHDIDHGDGAFTISVHRCPLKDAWREAGLPDDRVALLCRIAGAFDKGLFEAAGLAFDNSTWSAERGGGCCRIKLSARVDA
jgi:hypothetical protein